MSSRAVPSRPTWSGSRWSKKRLDRFMSEARALTNFAGNAVATVIIGKWVGEFDRAQATRVFHNEEPFDETTMLDDLEPSARPSSEAAWAGITEPHHAGAAVPAAPAGRANTTSPPA
jgi:hypothetical protein